MRYLIENPAGGARENVRSLDRYTGWTVIAELPDEVPAPDAEWTGAAWEVPLATRRARKWAEVKRLRDEKEDGFVVTSLGPVQADDRSKIKVSGLVQMALLAKQAGAPFEEEFTLADNSVALLDANAAIAMGMAVGQYVSTVHARARALRLEIEASQDPDQVDVHSGW